jgi:hypothetical protein
MALQLARKLACVPGVPQQRAAHPMLAVGWGVGVGWLGGGGNTSLEGREVAPLKCRGPSAPSELM